MPSMDRINRRSWIKGVSAAGAGLAFGGASGLAVAQAEKSIIIGMVYVGPRDDFGYNQAHYEAAQEIRKLPGIKMVGEENVPETQAAQKSMQGMISQDGATLLFPDLFWLLQSPCAGSSQENPTTRIAHCGGLWDESKRPKMVGSYFGYIEECQYLNGVIAGHMSKSKKIGFIAAKPIPQVLRNINAFTLGARSVNPDITFSVVFTGDWSMPVKEAEATNSLADQGVDVFTMHVDSPKVIVETAARRGKFVCGYHASQAKLAPNAYLTGAEWNWVTPYKQIVEAARTGKPHPNFLRGGLKEGYVKTSAYGPMVTEGARKQADEVKALMLKDQFSIFKGRAELHRQGSSAQGNVNSPNRHCAGADELSG